MNPFKAVDAIHRLEQALEAACDDNIFERGLSAWLDGQAALRDLREALDIPQPKEQNYANEINCDGNGSPEGTTDADPREQRTMVSDQAMDEG